MDRREGGKECIVSLVELTAECMKLLVPENIRCRRRLSSQFVFHILYHPPCDGGCGYLSERSQKKQEKGTRGETSCFELTIAAWDECT